MKSEKSANTGTTPVAIPRVMLIDAPDGNLTTLARTAERLTDPKMPPCALIGGMAVMARINASHRATTDLDSVTSGTSLVFDTLVSFGAVKRGASAILDGVTIDVIEVDAYEEADLPEDPLERAFIISHAWALASAAPVDITVVKGRSRKVTSVVLPVATPAALVAMKLQSVPQRRGGREHKRAGDCYDIYRLMVEHGTRSTVHGPGGIATALAHGPSDLGKFCHGQIRQLFVDEPERTRRWLRQGSAEMSEINLDDLRTTGEAVAERLSDELARIALDRE